MNRSVATLLFLLALIPCFGFAQTRTDWLDIKNKAVKDVRNYGVKGNGITDDWNALKSAFEAGGLIVIPPDLDILIDAPDGFMGQICISKDTHIINLGSTITQKSDGGAYALNMLGFETTADNISVTLENIKVDGANAAHVGIRVSCQNFSGGIVRISGCSIKNLAGGSRPYSSSGIAVYGLFDIVEIDSNTIKSVSRTTDTGSVGSQSATGVSVTQATGVTKITGNNINDIFSNASVSWVDADAIAVFAASATAVLEKPHSALISGNMVTNFSGRAVKLQTPGATVHGNTFRCLTGTTAANSNFIDAQVGRVIATNNTIFVDTAVTPGSSMSIFAGSGRYENHRVFTFVDNVILLEATVPYGVVIANDGLATTEVNCSGNSFRLSGALQAVRFLKTATTADLFPTTCKINGNKFSFSGTYQTVDLLYVGGAYFTDSSRANTYSFDVTNNVVDVRSTTFNAGYILYGDFTDAIYAGWIRINGNSGWRNGVRYTPQFAQILPESSFYFNGNASYTFWSEIPNVGGRNNLQIIKDTYGHVRLASATISTYTEYVGYAPPPFPLASWTWQQVSP